MVRYLDPYNVLYLVATELGTTPLAVLCKDRHAPLPAVRQLTAWLLIKWVHLPIVEVAGLLDVTYSTVLYYVRNVERRRRNGEWTDLCLRLARQV